MRNLGLGLSSGRLPLIHGSRWGQQLMGQLGAGWPASGSFSISACSESGIPAQYCHELFAPSSAGHGLTDRFNSMDSKVTGPSLSETRHRFSTPALALAAVNPVPEHYTQGLTHLLKLLLTNSEHYTAPFYKWTGLCSRDHANI